MSGAVIRPLVHMVWTRSLDNQPMAGRLVVARAVRAEVRRVAAIRESEIRPAVESGSRGLVPGAALAALRSLLAGRPMPLQCAIYANRREVRRVAAEIDPATATIYLDGVRALALLREVRRTRPHARIVVDLDDLMSRRMALLIAAGETLSPGFLIGRLPRFLVRWATGPLGRLLVRYEAATLPAAEAEVARLADAVVLLSTVDLADLPGDGRAARRAILPAVTAHHPPRPIGNHPIRFVFVGTDVLTQNRLTIDYLVELWRRHRFAAELVIYGQQARPLPLPPGVRYAGYVPDIAEAYAPGSVLVTPAFLRGGIKTKVLEAFAFGAPVIGNAATFEAMALDDYPLVCADEAALVPLLDDPAAHVALFDAAAQRGARYVGRDHDPVRFAAQWRDVLGLADAAPGGAPER